MKPLKSKIRIILYKKIKKETYLKILYFWYHKKKLNIDSPQRYSEKIFYLKIYNGIYLKELLQICYDKYTVRNYVTKIVGKKYLTKLYGVYKKPEEIKFNDLPDKYVLKVTQSCGYNIVQNGYNLMTHKEIIETLNNWLLEVNENQKQIETEENYYFTGDAQIICEEFLMDENDEIPLDIRFFCFNGKPQFYCIDFDSTDKFGNKKKIYYRNTYDMDHNLIPVNLGRDYRPEYEHPQLKNFDEMIRVAMKLSEDFIFVRVDLYNIDGRIVFGELTWIPQNGGGRITPSHYDEEFGRLLKLPNVKISI
ncbi:ATP-grasp fold amidoligase family protein [Eubacterium callanderi]|uniref:ATP-grasp fold amidoligase family protein n=1 Tax=Eubacterium callanderi TaxID=53442 RepID=UPI001C12949C|nr:ATP-grasp fold amidoligase family protein [Eubacterium callanderi]MBU5305924.1 hypothetical protein [Eubacterium callanderi]WPK68875.1 hypothetical protein EUCA2A_30490 [Eubacterium callanderi]WPK73173.1 hypothetical protein EUCA11A_30490 [Eubacterium callanderi]